MAWAARGLWVVLVGGEGGVGCAGGWQGWGGCLWAVLVGGRVGQGGVGGAHQDCGAHHPPALEGSARPSSWDTPQGGVGTVPPSSTIAHPYPHTYSNPNPNS